MPRPKVYFDFTVWSGTHLGRVVIELFSDTTPRMAENFRLLCTSEMGHYKGWFLVFDNNTYRAQRFFTTPIGYQQPQLDLSAENFIKKYNGPGSVLMLPGETGFNISLGSASGVQDQPYMVVGQVLEGLCDLLSYTKQISIYHLVISDCGELQEPWEETAGMLLSSNRQLSDTLKEIKNAKEQLYKVEASKEQFGDLDEMAKYVEHNLDTLNDLEAEIACLKEHQSEMATRILKLKEGKVVLEAIPSFPDEVLDDIERAIKKLKSDRPH